jgi:hypothetical protein
MPPNPSTTPHVLPSSSLLNKSLPNTPPAVEGAYMQPPPPMRQKGHHTPSNTALTNLPTQSSITCIHQAG